VYTSHDDVYFDDANAHGNRYRYREKRRDKEIERGPGPPPFVYIHLGNRQSKKVGILEIPFSAGRWRGMW
jgi:hypothetical protein